MTDSQLLEQFQCILQAIETSETKTQSLIAESELRMKVFIENQVTKRIDSLFDGYKLTHEKQWELERRTDQLQEQLELVQARLAALENKSA